MKAKLALLEASPSTSQSLKPFQSKNKGLVAKTFDWDEKEVSNVEEITHVRVLMALADYELSVGKNYDCNGEWIDITMRKIHIKKPIWYVDSGCLKSDHLGKFDAKADDGYFPGYSFVSKVFRVFNTRRQQIEETYHDTFNESIEATRKKWTRLQLYTKSDEESHITARDGVTKQYNGVKTSKRRRLDF
uniref:Retrovirus-related Pol polyprotein from transposon TNT 1-94 n=1 Tax=Tanacetum cinerariifolium TaxID=118510 RepID=A0A6L2JER7_TANCI|nr:retrovirus-related Pol polyprotein from transposon TNT 1-94 [Tanacetum cinerariifolium]